MNAFNAVSVACMGMLHCRNMARNNVETLYSCYSVYYHQSIGEIFNNLNQKLKIDL